MISRREMLMQVGSMLGVAAIAPRALVQAQGRRGGWAAVGNVFFPLPPAEAKPLGAIRGLLIPADENGPGALEARADRFIDRALAGALKNLRPVYGAGLAAVDS